MKHLITTAKNRNGIVESYRYAGDTLVYIKQRKGNVITMSKNQILKLAQAVRTL